MPIRTFAGTAIDQHTGSGTLKTTFTAFTFSIPSLSELNGDVSFLQVRVVEHAIKIGVLDGGRADISRGIDFVGMIRVLTCTDIEGIAVIAAAIRVVEQP